MGLTSFVLGNNQWFEADCISVALPNGFVINATSHQRDLVVGGTTYYASKYGKWARGKVTHERNAVTEMDLTLACNEAVPFPIPQSPGVDVLLASDTFVRANANPIGAPYAALSGSSCQIVSNAVESTGTGVLSNAYNTTLAFTPDQWSEVTVGSLVSSSDYCAAFVRMINGISGYVLYITGPIGAGASWTITKYAAGTPTTVTSGSIAAAAGDKFRLEVIGTTLIARKNGALFAQVTDTTYAAGVAGFGLVNGTTIGNSTITGWSGGNVLAANASTDNLLASDNFTRANSNPIGAPWTTQGNAVQIVSNVAESTVGGGSFCGAYFSGIAFPSDQWSEITIGTLPTSSDFSSAMVRMSGGAASGYALWVQGPLGAGAGGVEIEVYPSGRLLLNLTGVTVTAGDKFRIEVQGTLITVRQNGVIIGQATDSTIASGSPGFAFENTTAGNSTNTKWQGGSITQGNPNVAMFQRSKLFLRSKVTVTTAYLDLPTQTVQGTYVAFVGYVTSPSLESTVVTFKCSDPGYMMQLSWPRRVIQAACPYAVFDPNCTLNKSSFQQTRTVAYGSNGNALVISSALAAIGNDALPFTLGYIVPVTGQCAGFSIPIVQQTSSTQLTLAPFDLPLQVGDQIVLVPGCNHLFTTCQLKYNNLPNFGGFPFVPGPESSLTGN